MLESSLFTKSPGKGAYKSKSFVSMRDMNMNPSVFTEPLVNYHTDEINKCNLDKVVSEIKAKFTDNKAVSKNSEK